MINIFFFNDTATTEIYTLSLHDALPISESCFESGLAVPADRGALPGLGRPRTQEEPCALIRIARSSRSDRKSTRLNSSHSQISYAVFCLKKKKAASSSRTRRRIPATYCT